MNTELAVPAMPVPLFGDGVPLHLRDAGRRDPEVICEVLRRALFREPGRFAVRRDLMDRWVVVERADGMRLQLPLDDLIDNPKSLRPTFWSFVRPGEKAST